MVTELGGYGAVEAYARDVGTPLPHWNDHPPDGAIPDELGGLAYTTDNGDGLEVWSKMKGEDPVHLGAAGASSKWTENSSGQLEPKDGQAVSVEQLNNTRLAESFDGASGSEKINNAIADLNDPGVVVTGPEGPDDVSGSTGSVSDGRESHAWKLTSTVEIPDNVTVLLVNSYWFAEDGLDTNPMTNADQTNGNDNISVVGLGDATIDGNARNQNRSGKDRKWICMEFVRGEDLTIEGLTIRNPAAWSIKTAGVDDITVDNIRYDHDGQQGNQDGVHIIGPASGVSITDLSGHTRDDLVAIDARAPQSSDAFHTETEGTIKEFTVSDIPRSQKPVKLLNDDSGSELNKGTISAYNTTNGATTVIVTGSCTNPVKIRNIAITGTSSAVPNQVLKIDAACRGISLQNAESDRGRLLNVQNDCEAITLNGCNAQGAANTGNEYINVANGVTVDGLTVDGLTTVDSFGGSVSMVARIDGTVNDLLLTDLNVVDAGTVLGGSGSANGRANDWQVNEANVSTVYGSLFDIDFGDGVPPLASGALTLTSGSTGVQTATEAGVTTQEGRQLNVDVTGVDATTTPDADYAWREERHDQQWDDSEGNQDAIVRVNLVTDPGSNFDVEYEVKPGAA